VYGSDLQLVETVRGVVSTGWEAIVVLPCDGPLVPLLELAGARVVHVRFPVLRRSTLSPAGLVRLALLLPVFAAGAVRTWRTVRPDRLLVNTLTIPWWLVVGALLRTPTVCHVHEAEVHLPRTLRTALALPLRLATTVVANSRTTATVVQDVVPVVRARTSVVYNGVAAPPRVTPPRVRQQGDELRLVLVSRLSPRKGIDVALDAVALLRGSGRDVRIRLCGSVFPGYEWFEQQLRSRAAEPDLCGAVDFLGYVARPEEELARADIVLVPSFGESFGNVAVEALLAQRPLVASGVQGLTEIVRDGSTGLLVPAGDAAALAGAVRRLADDPDQAAALAASGIQDARTRFGVERYRREIADRVLT
jgi:glycosyltransferase involved in cell wall biosynthesis